LTALFRVSKDGRFVPSNWSGEPVGNSPEIARQNLSRKPGTAAQVLALLDSLANLVNRVGFNQLDHAVQTATRAELAGADDVVVVAALCHDIGKAISVPNHAAIGAEILRPYVRPEVYELVLAHRDFQRPYAARADELTHGRSAYRDRPWYDFAVTFVDDWDDRSHDPDYPAFPLGHFADRVRDVFAAPRYFPGVDVPW
jgi:predicted HD phosphohydrolase